MSSHLREYADALDSDRGHGKSRVTALMREAADEIERLREIQLISYPMTPVDCLISELGEMFLGGTWRSQEEHEKAFWERVSQFRREVMAE